MKLDEYFSRRCTAYAFFQGQVTLIGQWVLSDRNEPIEILSHAKEIERASATLMEKLAEIDAQYKRESAEAALVGDKVNG